MLNPYLMNVFCDSITGFSSELNREVAWSNGAVLGEYFQRQWFLIMKADVFNAFLNQ